MRIEDRLEVCPCCGLETPWGTVLNGRCPSCRDRAPIVSFLARIDRTKRPWTLYDTILLLLCLMMTTILILLLIQVLNLSG